MCVVDFDGDFTTDDDNLRLFSNPGGPKEPIIARSMCVKWVQLHGDQPRCSKQESLCHRQTNKARESCIMRPQNHHHDGRFIL